MPFGEYELSPSLIGLSLLHSTHPEAFQRLLVRASIRCYPDFTLDKCRSLGFASASADSTPCSGSLSLRLRASLPLTSPATATRRFIMQKARRHRLRGSDRLWAHGFRYSFTPLLEVLFTFPSRYWFTIGLTGVFSLAGWSRQIHAGFLVTRATQDAAAPGVCFAYGALTLCGPPFQDGSARDASATMTVLLPRRRASTPTVWALPRSLATTGGITVVFSSCGY